MPPRKEKRPRIFTVGFLVVAKGFPEPQYQTMKFAVFLCLFYNRINILELSKTMKETDEEPIKWVNEKIKGIPQNYDIYKIIPLKYLLAWLKSNKIRFDQIAKWDDVYELFLFKQKYYSNVNGQKLSVDMDAVSHAIYGQSWSLRKESDVLWRIYSPDHLSVKIHTTTGKLIAEMQKCGLSNSHFLAYLGGVKYYSLKGLQNQMTQYHKYGVTKEETMAYSLFDKRNVISYEKEFGSFTLYENKPFYGKKL